MTQSAPIWAVDPDDPRAPPTEIWEPMSPEERARVIAARPSEFPVSEAQPPEGDDYLDVFTEPREALRRWFRGRGGQIYVAGNLPIYDPGERMSSPDRIAVDNAEQRQRDSWSADAEGGKGLDVAIEIVVRGRRKKDLEVNVERPTRLGIPEYYLFDRRRMTLTAWELEGPSYRRRVAQAGRFHSAVLGLDLWLDGTRLGFSVGEAPVPFTDARIDRVTRLSNEAGEGAERLEGELVAEQRRREEEQRRREQAEAEVARLRAKLESLRTK